MNKHLCCLLGILICCLTLKAQDKPAIALKWAPLGLVTGNIGLQGEYNFGKNSLTARIGLPARASHNFKFDGENVRFQMKATSFMAGYRSYFSKKTMKGLYAEPYFKYIHHTSEGMGTSTLDNQRVTLNFVNDYNGIGIGAQLGAQFLIGKRFVIDLYFLGPEINSVSNKFKAVDMTHTNSWNDIQAGDAERDIREFLNQFPFLRNNVDVVVDKDNRSVLTSFRGIIPGFRAGFSLGFAF